jgi:hypothetical protein
MRTTPPQIAVTWFNLFYLERRAYDFSEPDIKPKVSLKNYVYLYSLLFTIQSFYNE